MFGTIADELQTQIAALEDEEEVPTFGKVLIGMPEKLSISTGPVCVIELYETPEIRPAIRGSNYFFRINVALTVIVKGMLDTSVSNVYTAMDSLITYLAGDPHINSTAASSVIKTVGFGPIQVNKTKSGRETRDLYYGGVLVLEVGKGFAFNE
jgi:hypothetical protein